MQRTLPREIRRAMVVLAALKMSNTEATKLHRFLRGCTSDEFGRLLRDVQTDHFFETQAEDSDSADLLASSTEATVVNQVLGLLRDEANLRNAEIVQALSHKVTTQGGLTPREFDRRKSIAEWLNQLIRLVGPSRVLGLATHIRNEVVQQNKNPWSVEGEK